MLNKIEIYMTHWKIYIREINALLCFYIKLRLIYITWNDQNGKWQLQGVIASMMVTS